MIGATGMSLEQLVKAAEGAVPPETGGRSAGQAVADSRWEGPDSNTEGLPPGFSRRTRVLLITAMAIAAWMPIIVIYHYVSK